MTNTEDHEKIGKTALSLTGRLRIIREDLTDIYDKLLVTEFTSLETAALDSLLEAAQEDITSLRARLSRPMPLTETQYRSATSDTKTRNT